MNEGPDRTVVHLQAPIRQLPDKPMKREIPPRQPLIDDVHFDALIADKAFDAGWLREQLDQRGASAVIPSLANRKRPAAYDKHMYRWRHLIENYFAKIKEFRGIATRYDKTDISCAANWNLVATIIAMR